MPVGLRRSLARSFRGGSARPAGWHLDLTASDGLPLHTRDVVSGVDDQDFAGDALPCIAEKKGGRLRYL
jgi:hypothetical protein